MSWRVRARTKDTGRVTRPAGTNNPAYAADAAAAAAAVAAARPHHDRSKAIKKRLVAPQTRRTGSHYTLQVRRRPGDVYPPFPHRLTWLSAGCVGDQRRSPLRHAALAIDTQNNNIMLIMLRRMLRSVLIIIWW